MEGSCNLTPAASTPRWVSRQHLATGCCSSNSQCYYAAQPLGLSRETAEDVQPPSTRAGSCVFLHHHWRLSSHLSRRITTVHGLPSREKGARTNILWRSEHGDKQRGDGQIWHPSTSVARWSEIAKGTIQLEGTLSCGRDGVMMALFILANEDHPSLSRIHRTRSQ